MLKSVDRYRLMDNGRFSLRPSFRPAPAAPIGASPKQELGFGGIGGGGFGIPQNTVTRAYARPTSLSVSNGLIADDHQSLVRLSREIYQEDAVSGSVVDLISMIPFGDFALSGIPSEMMEPYIKSMDRMRIKSLFPAVGTTYLCDGAFLGTLIFNEKEKIFDGIIPQDLMAAMLTPVPFFGAAPLIDMQITTELSAALGNQDPRMQRYTRHIPKNILSGGGVAKLQPENTLYIPRKTRADYMLGTSIFRRIMPVYMLEKALLRGTIEIAYRRQRGLLHVVCGDDAWTASLQELQEITNMFMAADIDPTGGVLATRTGIQPNEVGSPSDAWRWVDSVDVITQVKLKGLGTPDGLLGGDMSLDSVGNTMTVFIQQTKSFRDYIVRSMLYEKIFAYLAVTNDHRKDQKFLSTAAHMDTRAQIDKFYGQYSLRDHMPSLAADSDIEMSNYMVPVITFHNSMRPEGDSQYLDLLRSLAEEGVPIPIRMKAAAAGVNIMDIVNGADDDLRIQQLLAEYSAKIAVVRGQNQPLPPNDADLSEMALHDMLPKSIKRRGLLNREWDDRHQPANIINGHRYLSTANHRRTENEKADRTMATAAATVSQKINRHLLTETIDMTATLNGVFGR